MAEEKNPLEQPMEGQTTDTDDALDAAMNDLDSIIADIAQDAAPTETDETTAEAVTTAEETEAPAEGEAESAESGEAKLDIKAKLAAAKEKMLSAAGTAKEGAGKAIGGLKDKMNSQPKKKKKKKKKKKPYQPTFEDELADLAAEEAQFDEWGRPIRRKKKRRKRKKSRKLSCTLVLLTFILAMSSVLSVAILGVAKEMYGIDKDVAERVITIPAGSTVTNIIDQLTAENMISLPQVFRLVSRMKGKDAEYIAGEHVLSASMSYEAMIEELCTNYEEKREYVRVTFREGITLLDAAKILQENEVCKSDKFLFFFNSGGYGFKFEEYLPDSANANPLKFQRMEGYCFPDTYEFYVGEDPNIVAQKIYANFDSKLTDGDYRKIQELGMTLDEVVTLASIVQGEAPSMDVMKKVASVFHNRLQNRTVFDKLQSDPTRKYAEQVIAPNLQIQNELMMTAYNTYAGQGLPPGAINNPGKDAIEATLYPTPTNYYFFVANVDTLETLFATTNEEHERNIAIIKQQYAAAQAAANGNG